MRNVRRKENSKKYKNKMLESKYIFRSKEAI
jgi:hypothetical protein